MKRLLLVTIIILMSVLPSFAGSWRTGIRVYDNDMYLRFVVETGACSTSIWGCKVFAADRSTILFYIKDNKILDKNLYKRGEIK